MRLKCHRLVGEENVPWLNGESREAMCAIQNSRRSQLKLVVCLVTSGLVITGLVPRASAYSGSAQYTFGSAVSENESQYTLYYSVPPVIHAGVGANLTFFVYLTELSGWKINSQMQVLRLIVNTPDKSVTTQEARNSVILYQGA